MTKKKTVPPVKATAPAPPAPPMPAPPPPAPAKPPAKKRGSYKKVECPYCHAYVGNLGNHVMQKHPGQDAKPREMTRETLLGVPEKPEAPEVQAAKRTYFCETCAEKGFAKKAQLRPGEETCWQCGAVLNWEGLV